MMLGLFEWVVTLYYQGTLVTMTLEDHDYDKKYAADLAVSRFYHDHPKSYGQVKVLGVEAKAPKLITFSEVFFDYPKYLETYTYLKLASWLDCDVYLERALGKNFSYYAIWINDTESGKWYADDLLAETEQGKGDLVYREDTQWHKYQAISFIAKLKRNPDQLSLNL